MSKQIILLKKEGTTPFAPIFYKGASHNLAELTDNGTKPFTVTDEELIVAVKHGLGSLIMNNTISIVVVPEVVQQQEQTEQQEQPKPVIPEPATVIKDETAVIKDDANDSKTSETAEVSEIKVKRTNRSRKK